MSWGADDSGRGSEFEYESERVKPWEGEEDSRNSRG
uniref:Uncharacterized protein n=1 Tax=Nelumbo nucifera TaxID=4432 RepID=A0A822Y923_NELNU|nr:TPA_asm: hypothetical protein HUJ06_029257 [Nelumbo nucifera]